MTVLVALKPFDPWGLLLVAALNPIVVVVAVLMGRIADQPQKLLISAFVASYVGVIAVWVLTHFEILPAHGFGQTGGLLIAQFVIGLFWAWVGYQFLRVKSG